MALDHANFDITALQYGANRLPWDEIICLDDTNTKVHLLQ